MTIAVLGWGSLIYQPGKLSLAGDWHIDGPFLPIEFARQSEDERMTLVIVDGIATSQTLWAEMDVASLEIAQQELARREKANLSAIGTWPSAASAKPCAALIGAWAQDIGLSGVVWTALQPGFRHARGVVPTLDATLAHLENLVGTAKTSATEYIAKAPTQVQTPFRPALEKALRIISSQ